MIQLMATISILQFLFWAFVIVALIIVILRRIKEKEKEDFEKRDN